MTSPAPKKLFIKTYGCQMNVYDGDRMADALAPGARLVHPDWKNYEVLFEGGARGGNVAWEATVVRGDTEAAFARDDVVVVESCFRVGRQNHVSLEPRAVVASYEDGRYHIETSTQVPWTVRNMTAKLLGVPASQVHVTVPPVGGGFGQKFDCTLEPYAAILARKSGQPVRLVYSRQEEMLTCLCRENAEIKIRSAVTRSGDIAGREAVVLMDCGAYGGEQTERARELWTYNPMNFARLAEDMGALGIRVERANEFAPALARALAANRPAVIDVVTDVEALAPTAVA